MSTHAPAEREMPSRQLVPAAAADAPSSPAPSAPRPPEMTVKLGSPEIAQHQLLRPVSPPPENGLNAGLGVPDAAQGSPQKLRVPSAGISPRRKPVPSALEFSQADSQGRPHQQQQAPKDPNSQPPSPTARQPATVDPAVKHSPSMPYSVPLSSFTSSSAGSGSVSSQTPRALPRSNSHSFAPASAPLEPVVPRQRSLGGHDSLSVVGTYPQTSSAFGSSAATPSSTSRNTPSTSFPMTPDPPSPSNIDRRGLVGVGELATPRWAGSIGAGANWSQPPTWQDASPPAAHGADAPSSWDYKSSSAVGERNRSWGKLATEVFADVQAANASDGNGGGVRTGKSLSHALGQHARDISGAQSGSHIYLGPDALSPDAEANAARIQPSLMSAYDPQRNLAAVGNGGDPAPVSPLTANDTSSSFFAPLPPATESHKTYAAGLLAASEADAQSSTATSSPRSQRKRRSDQFQYGLPPAEGEAKTPSKEKNGTSLDLLPWGGHPAPGVAASPQKAEFAKASPTTPTGTEGRKSRERRHSSSKSNTPSSPGHDIVRQFSASHDFSHLPPSPSSSSIQRFIRQSSVSNLSAAAAGVPAVPPVPAIHQLQRQNSLSVVAAPPYPVTPPSDEPRRLGSQSGSSPGYPFPKRASSKNLDPETMEALRRLDGLGRSPSSNTKYSTRSGWTHASSGAADDATSVKSRPGTPSATPDRHAANTWSRSSMPTMPTSPQGTPGGAVSEKFDVNISPRSASFAVARTSQGGSSSVSSKRGSSSSTTTSPYSTAPSSNTAGTRASISGLPPKVTRKNSASSDLSGALSEGESVRERTASITAREEQEDIPPVPPLPKAFDLGSRSPMNQLSNTAVVPQAARPSPTTTIASSVVPATPPPASTSSQSAQPRPLPAQPIQAAQQQPSPATSRRPSQQQEELAADTSVLSSSISPRRSATKKWSISNAISKLSSSSKHSFSSTDDGQQPLSPTMPQPANFGTSLEQTSPPILWSTEENGGSSLRKTSDARKSLESYVMPSPPPGEAPRRHPSTASLAPPQAPADNISRTPSSSGKRLTPSSIPFFRRSSSTSMNKHAAVSSSSPRPPVPATPTTSSISTPRKLSSTSTQESTASSASGHRKSVLGTMSLSGMLRSSSSRRSLAAAAAAEEQAGDFGSASKRTHEASHDAGEKEKSSPGGSRLSTSLGLLGRRRGKTVTSQDKGKGREIDSDVPGLPQQTVSRMSSFHGRNDATPTSASSLPISSSLSASSSTRRQSSLMNAKSSAVLRTSRAHLPTISGSPSSGNLSGQALSISSSMPPPTTGTVSTSSSYSRISDATPTKIPRIASRQSRQLGTPTSAQPSLTRRGSETATLDSFQSGITRTESNLSEFGPVDEEPNATPAQRYRSLANVSDSTNRRYSSITTSASTGSFASRQPRQLPVPPSSSSAAISASKRLPSKDSLAGPRRLPSSSSVNSGLADAATGTGIINPRTLPSKLQSTQPSRMAPSSSSTSLATTVSVSRSASASPVVVDDDEAIGDEEMRQFMKRQRAKKAASGATSAEIEAMMNYPEPIDPTPAKTPLATIKAHFHDLSDYEKREITEYTDIYHVGKDSKKKMAKLDDGNLNHGYDDDRGDYLVVSGDHLAFRYEIMGVLGKGSFGQVLQCRDHKTGQAVAVKIIRNKKRFHHQALVEVKILDNLRKWDPEQRHCVIVMTEHFYFRNHLCIATELLSINLYELIKANSFAGFTTTLIRRFTVQMLQSLILLRQHRVVHCDLKPENILLSHPSKSGIKVIDFGSSCFEHEKVYTYIQSRFYRSPEVILGCNYSQAIDMWSLGCILAELYTGFPIFPGENEQEQLSCIMEVLGLPDKYIVDKSSRKNIFFDSQGAARPVVNSKGKRRRPGTKTLNQVLKTDDELFVDFIAKCLTWDPDRRLKPLPALRHPWLVKQRLGTQTAQIPGSAGSRLSQAQTPSVTSRITSSLTGTGRTKAVAETPKKALNIGAPTPLSARVRSSNIVGGGPSTPSSSNAAGNGTSHSAHASLSSTNSFRQHRASQQALTSSASNRHIHLYGSVTTSSKI